MAEQKTQFLIDEDGAKQTDPIYLSSDEDSITYHRISERDLTNDHNEFWLSQVLIQLNDPSDKFKVTIPSVEKYKSTLSRSATTDSQQGQKIHIVSPI